MSTGDRAPGNRSLDLRIEARPQEVVTVRRALAHMGLPASLLYDASLLVSELVANSIRHAGLSPKEEIRVTVRWSDARLRVEVHDRDPSDARSPVSGSIRPLTASESGWGLYLVERLSARWGATPGRYWFELDLRDEGG